MSETDAEFVERVENKALLGHATTSKERARLFALARRGAAIADQERKTRAIMGDPLQGFHLPSPPKGAED